LFSFDRESKRERWRWESGAGSLIDRQHLFQA